MTDFKYNVCCPFNDTINIDSDNHVNHDRFSCPSKTRKDPNYLTKKETCLSKLDCEPIRCVFLNLKGQYSTQGGYAFVDLSNCYILNFLSNENIRHVFKEVQKTIKQNTGITLGFDLKNQNYDLTDYIANFAYNTQYRLHKKCEWNDILIKNLITKLMFGLKRRIVNEKRTMSGYQHQPRPAIPQKQLNKRDGLSTCARILSHPITKHNEQLKEFERRISGIDRCTCIPNGYSVAHY